MPMQLDISTKGDKNIFNLTPSAGREEAIKEMEKRLEQLVSAYSVFLEQDIEGTQTK